MVFSVTKGAQMLVKPSEPTPSDPLKLSVIDRVAGLRHMVRSLHVFEKGVEPTRVIREALAKALVLYYPFAGRFKVEEGGGEVVMECNGEGAWFVEAVASCRLEDVRMLEHPLMISPEKLLPDPRPEFDPIDIPMMMQVTEFQCGGFVVGLITIHTLADGLGAAQLITAISELARGLPAPTIAPIHSRHLIPNPPPPPPPPSPLPSPSFKFLPSVFDLPLSQIHQLKSLYFASTATHCSAFDAILALVWRARTRAINLPSPQTLVHVIFFASTRHLLPETRGFYGNCIYPVTVTAPSAAIAYEENIVQVIRRIRDAKGRLREDFGKWARGYSTNENPYEFTFSYETLFVSDWSRVGFLEVDYGWGMPLHVVPFQYVDCMAVAIMGAPRKPMQGMRVMTQCVEKEHLGAFQENMNERS